MVQSITSLPTAPSRSDAPATFITRADAFLGALGQFCTELNQFGTDVTTIASSTNYNATSATSVTIGTGSKSFTASTGSLLQVGQFVVVANTATPANYMTGQVTAYNSSTGALTVNVTATGGTGTFSAWTISLTPTGGALLASGGTMTGALVTAASTTSAAGIRVPHGTAPTTPTNGDIWSTTSGLLVRINGVTQTLANSASVLALTGGTLTGKLTMVASGTGAASLRIPHGTAPSSPSDGDVWTTTGGVFARVNGSTQQLTGAWTQIGTASATGASISFTSIPTTYSDLLVVFETVSGDAVATFGIAFSTDNVTYTSSAALNASSAAGVNTSGAVFIPRYLGNKGMFASMLAPDSANNTIFSQTTTSSNFGWRVDSGIKNIRLAPSSGNFDAGTITLYGR